MIHTRPCTISGCRHDSRAFSPYCPKHRRALSRNGHPEQSAIRAPELGPYLALIARRQADNQDSEAFTILRQRWAGLVEWSMTVLSQVEAGKAYARIDAQTARLIRDIAGAAAADTVYRLAMSVVMFSRDDPRRFRADRTVPFQMARQVIRLAPGSMGTYYDHQKRAVRSVRRDHPPRVLEHLGQLLMDAFGGAAVQLHHIEQTRVSKAEVEQRALAAALQALKA